MKSPAFLREPRGFEISHAAKSLAFSSPIPRCARRIPHFLCNLSSKVPNYPATEPFSKSRPMMEYQFKYVETLK
jgi:hypothetical protein